MNPTQQSLFLPSEPQCKVRCISLWQPWASLMAVGVKTVETRGWYTEVRGEIYIHAAKTRHGITESDFTPGQESAMEKALGMPRARWGTDLPFGSLIAVGDLAEVLSGPAALARFPEQEPFGGFDADRWGHVYENLRAIGPIPCRGAQGFFFAEIPVGEGKA